MKKRPYCLVQCDFTEACSREAGFSFCSNNNESFADWLNTVMGQVNNSMLARLVMLMWSIWKARNTVAWNDTYLHVDEVVRSAHFTLDQWTEALSRNFSPSGKIMHSKDGKELWMKPVGNTIKINVDAALFNDVNSFGFGCVARDSSGRVMGARAASHIGIVSAELAEAVAFKE